MKTSTTEHIIQVIEFLNEYADYAVLRNYEGLPRRNDSRDIDIIITRRSYRSIREMLVRLIDESGWKILTYLHSDRLITYVCACQEDGKAELVQWDFFFDTSVWGVLLMDAQEFLAHKQFNGFLYFVDTDCQFLDKYLYDRAVGKPYPAKYAGTRAKAEHLPAVTRKVKEVFGTDDLAVCDRLSRSHLMRSAVCHNLRRCPLALVGGVLRFLWTFTANYLRSRTGFSIGFTGPDGSGKTTVIDLLIESLGDVFRKAHVCYHFRPTLFGNLGEVAHKAGVKREVDRNYDQPHRGGKTGWFSSLCRLFYYSIDYQLGYLLRVKSVTRITRLVLFDRYFTDIICDSRRSRIYLSPRFLYGYGRLLIPRLDYNILLTASTDTILARKRELDRDGIEQINRKIDYLANKHGYYRIENETTPQVAVGEILRLVFEKQHRKNLKRLNF